MGEKIICFSLGLTPEDIEKGRVSYMEADREACTLNVIDITADMMAETVGDVLNRAAAGKEGDNASTAQGEIFKYRVVVVDTRDRQQVLQIMRSFKAVLPDPQNVIFALITDTARTWTFGDYIGHLAQEHEKMTKR